MRTFLKYYDSPFIIPAPPSDYCTCCISRYNGQFYEAGSDVAETIAQELLAKETEKEATTLLDLQLGIEGQTQQGIIHGRESITEDVVNSIAQVISSTSDA